MTLDRAIAAAGWSYLGTALRVVSQTLAQIALARLIGPDAFGIMALTVLPVALGSLVAELGLGPALIQKGELASGELYSAWSRTALAGLAVTALLLLAAPALAMLLAEPRITPVLRCMAPVVLLNALAAVPLASLKRELDLKRVQLSQLGGYLAGFVLVGISAALAGAGIWALVAAWLTFSAVSLLLVLRFSGLRPRFTSPAGLGGGTASFGRSILFTNAANWTVENLDNLVVGRLFGAQPLGLYSVSYNLVRTPANHLVTGLQAALFPATARSAGNLPHLQRGYLAVLSAVALVALPVFFTVAALSEAVVLALFGEEWKEAAGILVPLSLAMACHAPMAIAGPVLAGKGRPEIELRVQVITGFLFLGLLFFAAGGSARGIGFVVLAVYLIRMVCMTGCAVRELNIARGRLLEALRGPALLGAVVVLLAHLLDRILLSHGAGPLLRVTACFPAAAASLAAAVWLRPRFFLVPDLRHGVARFCDTHPALKSVGFFRRIAQVES